MSKHGQGDMPVPGSPQTDLVVIEPDFLFGCLKDLLDFPASSCHPDHLLQRCPPWSIHQVECEFCPSSDTATDEQPMLVILDPPMENGQAGPIRDTWPFGSFSHAHCLPVLLAKQWDAVFDSDQAHALLCEKN